MSEAEKDKAKALEEQRDLFRHIGGFEFRRTLDAYDLQQAKDKREIAFLEAHHMFVRSQNAGGPNSFHRSNQSLPSIPQAMGSRNSHAYPRNRPDSNRQQDTNQQLPFPQASIRSRSSTVNNVPQSQTHGTLNPQLPAAPTDGRNRSSTLGPFVPQPPNPAHHIPTGPNGVALNPVAAAPFREGQRYYSPFFCQDCGKQFQVDGVNDYESHRRKCKAKPKRTGVETGDLKAVKLARRNTTAAGSDPFRGLQSMPNLHAPLARVGIQNTGNRMAPMDLSAFRFPIPVSPPSKETQTVPDSGALTPSPTESEDSEQD